MSGPTSSDPAVRHTLLEGIVAGSTDAIVAVDGDDRVVLWNEGARRMFGYTADEMEGRLWRALVPASGTERRKYRRIRERLNHDGHINNVRTIRLAKDGRPVPVLLTRTLLEDADGNVLGSAILIKDLASLEELERRQARSDKLAAIGELVAHLAHEIRNPLNAVVLNYEMVRSALEEAPAGMTDRLREHLDIIGSGLKVLERSVSDFLRLARPAPAQTEPTDLGPVCQRAMRLLRQEAARRAVRLSARVPSALPPALADPGRLEHILLNLLRNAIEAVDEGGEVALAVRRRRRRLHIQVADTGPGMDDETRRRAFAPFFSTKPAGTGLGLAIVERLVHEMGGDVRCDTAPGQGTRFTVVLRTAEETPA